ncbi:MAG: MBL fold metallo-hydrolase [Gemmataceae bacterium]|nr:MBL fold metallo-hydrolase [Gemmataceae bacterium]
MCRIVSVVAALALLPALAWGQPAKPFKVRWYGQSFFQVESPSGKKIVTDPHQIPAFGRNLVSADIVTVSHDHNDHNVLDAVENARAARVFRGIKVDKGRADWDRIDEKVGAIRVRSVATYHDNENGFSRGKNAVFVLDVEGLTFCHLGDIGHELNAEQTKAIGKVDVLMIPVGGTYTINGEQAKKIVDTLKPRLHVFPMHYGVPNYDDLNGPDEFLDSQKLKLVRQPLSNEFTIAADAKPDAPTIVLVGTESKKK